MNPFTTTGFVKPTVPELRTQLQENFTAQFGPVAFGPNDVFGQMVEVLLPELEKMWAAFERIVQSIDPDYAEGTAQDASYAFVGAQRLGALATEVPSVVYGDEGTILDSTNKAKVSATDQVFSVRSLTTITATAAIRIQFSITDVLNETNYSVLINGVPVEFESDADATEQEIIDGLLAELATVDGVTAEQVGTNVQITADGFLVPFAFEVGDNTTLELIGSLCYFTADVTGPIPVPSFALNTIVTAVFGWDSVENILIGTLGRNVESSSQFRVRRAESLRITGGGTSDAMKSRIKQEVDGVTGVTILQNRSGITDIDGRPPHSYEVLVAGGVDQDIREKIWEVGPEGIQTHGNISGTIVDSQGTTQTIKFSRATQVYIWVRIELELYDEETFPIDGLAQVQENVYNYGITLDPGNDILAGRFNTPIYQVPGIRRPIIELAKTTTPEGTPTYSTNDLAISGTEQGVFDLTRVIVTVAP